MASRDEILARAREIIEIYPTAGKNRVNQFLRAEFGVGLRSAVVLDLKRQVATERPQLLSQLYAKGGVPRAYREVYKGWLDAGFLPFEARELTLGHGDRYMKFDAQAVFDSIPGQKARDFRTKLIRDQLAQGWTKKQIVDNIIDFYRKGRKVDPWSHIRAEYKPRKKVDFTEYKRKARARAKAKQQRLKRKQRR